MIALSRAACRLGIRRSRRPLPARHPLCRCADPPRLGRSRGLSRAGWWPRGTRLAYGHGMRPWIRSCPQHRDQVRPGSSAGRAGNGTLAPCVVDDGGEFVGAGGGIVLGYPDRRDTPQLRLARDLGLPWRLNAVARQAAPSGLRVPPDLVRRALTQTFVGSTLASSRQCSSRRGG